jgi:sirohydrochlorin ferrochelatase
LERLHIAIVPVLLGAGERLFEDLPRDLPSQYECVEFEGSPAAAHARIVPKGHNGRRR